MIRQMRIALNRQKDVAYVSLTDYDDSDVARCYGLVEHDIGGEFRFDFDKSGRLLGFEVRRAARGLPPELLEQAERTTRADPE